MNEPTIHDYLVPHLGDFKYTIEYLKTIPYKQLVDILCKSPLFELGFINGFPVYNNRNIIIELIDIYINHNFFNYVDYHCGTTHIGEKLKNSTLTDDDLTGGNWFFFSHNPYFKKEIIRLRDKVLPKSLSDQKIYELSQYCIRFCNCRYDLYGKFENYNSYQLRNFGRALGNLDYKNKKDSIALFNTQFGGYNIKRGIHLKK